ncbi:MAG: hypothetical protein ASARMPREDX12_006830 [Alectoria sarmentosa]|nr:MAG: hypothetical protein ASARMPREDX12_006830 [Alectoria sarmentosa]
MFNSAVPTPSGDYSVLIIDTLEYGAGPRPQGEKAAGSKAKPLVPFEVSEPANVETRMTVYLTKADFCIPNPVTVDPLVHAVLKPAIVETLESHTFHGKKIICGRVRCTNQETADSNASDQSFEPRPISSPASLTSATSRISSFPTYDLHQDWLVASLAGFIPQAHSGLSRGSTPVFGKELLQLRSIVP